MSGINFRRIFAWSGLFSLLIVYALLWSAMLATPRVRTGSDFIGFYSYGRIAQLSGYQHIDEIEAQQRIQQQVVGHSVVPIFYTHLPFIAPLAALLVNEDYIASFERWAIVLLVLNALNTYVLVRVAAPRNFGGENLIILSAGAFLFFPTFSGFMNGQDTAILLLGVALWAWAILSQKFWLAGLALSLATVRPQLALMLAIPFLFRRREVFFGFVVGSGVLAAFTLAFVHVDGALKFIESIRYIESTIWVEPHSLDMPTISGIVRRNFTVLDPAPVRAAIWFLYTAGIVVFCYWWYRSREITARHLGLVMLAAVFFVPYAHYHDLIVLLIPIFCLLRVWRQSDIDQYYIAIIPLLVSVLCAAGFIGSGLLKFPIVFTIMLVLGWWLTRGGLLDTREQTSAVT